MNYQALKAKLEKRISDFPIRWAVSQKHLDEIIQDWGVEVSDLCTIGAGGVIRKTDVKGWAKLVKANYTDLQNFLQDDENLTEALEYELVNHEYCITYDPDDALEALGLDPENLTHREWKCLENAKTRYWSGR